MVVVVVVVVSVVVVPVVPTALAPPVVAPRLRLEAPALLFVQFTLPALVPPTLFLA
jgi:hypothetical protein